MIKRVFWLCHAATLPTEYEEPKLTSPVKLYLLLLDGSVHRCPSICLPRKVKPGEKQCAERLEEIKDKGRPSDTKPLSTFKNLLHKTKVFS